MLFDSTPAGSCHGEAAADAAMAGAGAVDLSTAGTARGIDSPELAATPHLPAIFAVRPLPLPAQN
jgi:hypothetical protein